MHCPERGLISDLESREYSCFQEEPNIGVTFNLFFTRFHAKNMNKQVGFVSLEVHLKSNVLRIIKRYSNIHSVWPWLNGPWHGPQPSKSS